MHEAGALARLDLAPLDVALERSLLQAVFVEQFLELRGRCTLSLERGVLLGEGIPELPDRPQAAADERGLVDLRLEHRALVVLVHARLGRGDEARAELHGI